jgi:hypothetical protein
MHAFAVIGFITALVAFGYGVLVVIAIATLS